MKIRKSKTLDNKNFSLDTERSSKTQINEDGDKIKKKRKPRKNASKQSIINKPKKNPSKKNIVKKESPEDITALTEQANVIIQKQNPDTLEGLPNCGDPECFCNRNIVQN